MRKTKELSRLARPRYHGTMPAGLPEQVLSFVRRHDLLHAGDVVGVAVSGGADSTGLLRILLDLRGELGIVLSIVHFHHGIRGAEADADERFVGALAQLWGLEFHRASGDAPAAARERGLSLETAARELRYEYFRQLLRQGTMAKIATAHTLDDQAETVLLKLLRGAGTKGLAGIHPRLAVDLRACGDGEQAAGASLEKRGSIVRPLLATPRCAVRQYLQDIGQEWREDASNRDLKHARNRVRHLLMPLLEREFNPAIRQTLAETAEIARAEEEYWSEAVAGARDPVLRRQKNEDGVEIVLAALRSLPLALRRRMVRMAATGLGEKFDLLQIEKILSLDQAPAGTRIELPRGWIAERNQTPELGVENGRGAAPPGARIVLQRATAQPASPKSLRRDYEYRLPVPGEVQVPELGIVVRAKVVPLTHGEDSTRYNRGGWYWDILSLGTELSLRNWRPGDRYWPAHTKAVRKVKELLQERRISGSIRRLWPVAAHATGELVWIRGFPVAEGFAASGEAREAVQIDVQDLREIADI